MRYILPVCESSILQCIRLFAYLSGEDMVERGIRPRIQEDGGEECLGAVRRIGRPGPMRENGSVEWFEAGADVEGFVKLNEAPT
jgi:hypothetical protein